MFISASKATRELWKFTVTTIDMSSVMRKQIRVIEAMTSQSLTPVMYSYSVSAASTGSALPPKGFSGFENSDKFGSSSASVVLSEMTSACLSSFPIVGEVGRGVVWRIIAKWKVGNSAHDEADTGIKSRHRNSFRKTVRCV
jgi:hypothetical protein